MTPQNMIVGLERGRATFGWGVSFQGIPLIRGLSCLGILLCILFGNYKCEGTMKEKRKEDGEGMLPLSLGEMTSVDERREKWGQLSPCLANIKWVKSGEFLGFETNAK